MNTPIEAKSISSLTGLLANPPQYPRNPTHDAHEPLVLYIVRVPGSKGGDVRSSLVQELIVADVFLSPLRPPTKASISLEALQSSLYYLHVDAPEDDILRQSIEIEQQTESEKAQSILRKPLPPVPYSNYPPSRRPSTPPKSYPYFQPEGVGDDAASQTARFAARGAHVRLSSNEVQSFSRKPVGARPFPGHQSLDNAADLPNLAAEHSTIDSGIPPLSAASRRNPVPWSPRLQIPGEQMGAQSPTQRASPEGPDSPEPQPHNHFDGKTRITLIRRDPASGSQWNVGKIVLSMTSGAASALQPVEVMINTPGYSRFARQFQPSVSVGNSVEIPLQTPISPSSAASPSGAMALRRTVGFRPFAENHRPSVQHIRTHSGDILSKVSNSAIKSRKVYSFISLWDGICTFSNGVDGRTLKCRHSLPTISSTQDVMSIPVAELRFNLPWSVLSVRDANKSPGAEAEKPAISTLVGSSAKTQWRRSVQQLKHKSWHPKSEIDGPSEKFRPASSKSAVDSRIGANEEDGRVSLQLGREKAGGGFKGNSAKLGKLIIEDEGLKMCDLLVGACMGVWWQHYMDGVSI